MIKSIGRSVDMKLAAGSSVAGSSVAGALLLLILPALLGGCVILVPFIESDYVEPHERMYSAGGRPHSGARQTAESKRQARARRKLTRLLAGLNDPEDVVRTNSATDLGQMGAWGTAAVPALAEAARNDSSKWVRRAAVKALAKIGTPDVIAPLQAATKDRDKYVAHSAARALRRVGGDAAAGAREKRLIYRVAGDRVEKSYR